MELREAREQVIDMGHTLIRAGLIARSWGNISCRINDHQFVITPSGRSYADLRPEEIVIVNIINEESWGPVIPSVEKGVHLDVYRYRPEVNAVIHTHQTEASALSAMGTGLPERYGETLKGEVRCAKYGFPGSDLLRGNICQELFNSPSSAVLMAHHGAVCMGDTLMDAFRCSFLLERTCEQYFAAAAKRIYGKEWQPTDFLYENVFLSLGKNFPKEVLSLPLGIRDGEGISLKAESRESNMPLREDSIFAKEVYTAIFKARPDIRYIRQICTPEIFTCSVLEQALGTYIDDFAQINGATMAWAKEDPDAVVAALGKNHGVLLSNAGALCCGSTLDEVDALALVAEKNAHARLIGELFPEKTKRTVPLAECEQMREFYLQNYSKRLHVWEES